MISINLVPEHLRTKKSSFFGDDSFNIPKEVLVGVGGAFIIFLVLAHIILTSVMVNKMIVHKNVEGQWKSLASDKANVDKVLNNLSTYRAKESTLGVLRQRDWYWAQKLNLISDLLPKGVWLSDIRYMNNVMTIEGSAVSKEQAGMLMVGDFVSNLKSDESFSDDFDSIEVGVLKRRTIGKIEVADFTIQIKVDQDQ